MNVPDQAEKKDHEHRGPGSADEHIEVAPEGTVEKSSAVEIVHLASPGVLKRKDVCRAVLAKDGIL